MHERIMQLTKKAVKVEAFSALQKDLSAVSEHADSDEAPQSVAEYHGTPRKEPQFSPSARQVKLDEPSAAKRRDTVARRAAFRTKSRSLPAAGARRSTSIDFTRLVTAMVM